MIVLAGADERELHVFDSSFVAEAATASTKVKMVVMRMRQ